MSELSFRIAGARPEPFAALPTLTFALHVTSPEESIQSIALQCQIRIEPQRRRYAGAEAERLLELFGETPRWGDTCKPFLWTNVSTILRGFSGEAERALPVPCSYDLEVAAAKYFHALEDGDVPLLFLFSGTVFAQGTGGMRVTQVPWHADAHYRLPVRLWREVMDLYFPSCGWLRLRRETLDALSRCKAERVLATWDDVIEALLQDGATRKRA